MRVLIRIWSGELRSRSCIRDVVRSSRRGTHQESTHRLHCRQVASSCSVVCHAHARAAWLYHESCMMTISWARCATQSNRGCRSCNRYQAWGRRLQNICGALAFDQSPIWTAAIQRSSFDGCKRVPARRSIAVCSTSFAVLSITHRMSIMSLSSWNGGTGKSNGTKGSEAPASGY